MDQLRAMAHPRAKATSPLRQRDASPVQDKQIQDLKKELQLVQVENDKLRGTMREMVDDYSRQLEVRDVAIKRLESQDFAQQQEMSVLIFKENETLKQENLMLKDKIAILDQELIAFSQRPSEQEFRSVHDELNRLNGILREKDFQIENQMAA